MFHRIPAAGLRRSVTTTMLTAVMLAALALTASTGVVVAQTGQKLPAQQPAEAAMIKQWWAEKNGRRPETPERIQNRAYVKVTPRGGNLPPQGALRTVPTAVQAPMPQADIPYQPTDPQQQWVPGRWVSVGGTWAWRPGTYQTPPQPGYLWEPGRENVSPWGYSQTIGHWIDPYERDPAANNPVPGLAAPPSTTTDPAARLAIPPPSVR